MLGPGHFPIFDQSGAWRGKPGVRVGAWREGGWGGRGAGRGAGVGAAARGARAPKPAAGARSARRADAPAAPGRPDSEAGSENHVYRRFRTQPPRRPAILLTVNAARTALVTGGARGIGEAIVRALADDGHRVVVADILDDAAAETAANVGGLAVHLDVTDTASVDRAVSTAEAELGPIGILVNNAGWDEFMPFLQTSEEFWNRVIEINYKGCLRVTHRVVPGMIEGGYGRVVNIGSDAARVGSSMEAVYSGAKGAVVSFTKTLAREVARHGLTANAVCPGPTETAMLGQMLETGGDSARTSRGAQARRADAPTRHPR